MEWVLIQFIVDNSIVITKSVYESYQHTSRQSGSKKDPNAVNPPKWGIHSTRHHTLNKCLFERINSNIVRSLKYKSYRSR